MKLTKSQVEEAVKLRELVRRYGDRIDRVSSFTEEEKEESKLVYRMFGNLNKQEAVGVCVGINAMITWLK